MNESLAGHQTEKTGLLERIQRQQLEIDTLTMKLSTVQGHTCRQQDDNSCVLEATVSAS